MDLAIFCDSLSAIRPPCGSFQLEKYGTQLMNDSRLIMNICTLLSLLKMIDEMMKLLNDIEVHTYVHISLSTVVLIIKYGST